MKKNYVVAVKSPSDWPGIHELLLQDGTLEDNIPSRACECVDKKITYSNRATYLLDEEEVELLSSNPAVKYIELDPNLHPEAYPFFSATALPDKVKRFGEGVTTRVYKSPGLGLGEPYDPPIGGGDPQPRTGWQLLRPQTRGDLSLLKQNDLVYSDPPSSYIGGLAENEQNRAIVFQYLDADNSSSTFAAFYGVDVKYSIEYFEGEDGSNVDCVVVDNGVWHGHPEFLDDDGNSQIKDIVLDGPYYIDPDYFNQDEAKTVEFLGRTTCTEAAALEWWSDPTARSPQFAEIGTISGIPATYTRANVCGDFTSYPAHSVKDEESTTFAQHGTPVASLFYGKTFGWAFKANKWNIAANINTSGVAIDFVLNIEKIYEILNLFSKHRPNNALLDGKKNPIVINNSYSISATISFAGQRFYKFRNEFGSFATKETAPGFLTNFISDTISIDTTSLSTKESGEELVSLEGVYFFCSSGNSNQNQVNPGDADYDNWIATVQNPTESQKTYVNRRGFPANVGYNSFLKEYRAFSVSNLSSAYSQQDYYENGDDNLLNSRECKSNSSNSGKACDFIAPGETTFAAAGNQESQEFVRADNPAAFDLSFDGTSAASPVGAGFFASKLSKLRYWNPVRLKSYIKNIIKSQDTEFDLYTGPNDIATSNSEYWQRRDNLFGQSPKIIINDELSQPTELEISSQPDISVVPDATNKINLGVVLGNNTYALSYKYQWQKSTDDGVTWEDIVGQTGNYLNIQVTSADNGTKYRCFIDSEGPYLETYTTVSTLTASGEIEIISQPIASISVVAGKKLELSVTATAGSGGSLSYQWQKKNPIIQLEDQFEDIEGANLPTYVVEQASENSAGEYRCKISSLIATNSPLYSNVSVVTIVDSTLLSITNQSESLSILYGGSGSIFVSVSNGTTDFSTISYQWQKLSVSDGRWNDISEKTQSSVLFSNAIEADSGSYRCVISDPSASNTPLISNVISVSVRKNTLSIISQTGSISAFEGQNISLEVNAFTNSGGQILYQWQKLQSNSQWVDVVSATENKYSIINATLANGGSYRCKILDPLASNSPSISDIINVIVTEVNLSLTANLPATFTTLEGDPITLSLGAYLNDGREPSFKWEREGRDLNNRVIWEVVEINLTGSLVIPRATLNNAGKYRCVISDNIANNSPITSNTCVVSVQDSFTVSTASSQITKSVGDSLTLDSGVSILNPNLIYRYQWQRRQRGGTTWVNISGATSSTYSFEASGSDYLDGFRCEVNNGAGRTKYSGTITLNLNPFFAIISQPPVKIEFKRNSEQDYDIYPEVESTNPSAIAYQWELSTDNKTTWSSIVGRTSRILSLTPEDILSLSANDYFLRCNLIFNSETIYTDATLIDLKSNVNLFGYNSCLNAEQVIALADEGIDTNEIYKTDKCKDQNSCGVPVEELLETYSFYSTQKGIYKSWGDIIFPWDIISGPVTNLNISETDNKWRITSYKANNAYFIGERVLLIENDGFELSLFEALAPVPAISGPFDRSKWNKLCSVKTTIPVGLLSIEELKKRYEFFSLESFLKKWGEVDSKWSAELYNKVYTDCLALYTDLSDIEKCVKEANPTSSNDEWEEYKLKKTNFYEVGDYILTEGPCKDNLCLYINVRAIPVSEENFELHRVFSPVVNGVVYWEKVYCVTTGVNKCLGPQSKRDLPNYQLVQIGSEGHYVEQPLPFYELQGKKLYAEYETLNEYSEAPQPKVLTQEEIDAL